MAEEQSSMPAGSAPTFVEAFALSVTAEGLMRVATWALSPDGSGGATHAPGPSLVMTLAAADAFAGLLRSEVNKATGVGSASN